MPVRLKLIVAYDGGFFAGWQSQSHGNTIQDHLELALSQIARSAARVHGAGRTDAGVHALAQCAHVDLAEKRLSPDQWTAALNALLPPQIRVLKCRYVTDRFHARYSAKGKIYRYCIWSGAVLPPLEVGRAWHIAASLDDEILRSSANVFLGTHDFSGFAANRGKPATNTVRTIRSVRVRRSGARGGAPSSGGCHDSSWAPCARPRAMLSSKRWSCHGSGRDAAGRSSSGMSPTVM